MDSDMSSDLLGFTQEELRIHDKEVHGIDHGIDHDMDNETETGK